MEKENNKKRQKYDNRIKKTDQALVKALFSLLSEKKFEEITVQAICDSASIRRATFYTHFNDKYELFGYAIKCTYQTFPSYSALLTQNRTKEMYLILIKETINFITYNEELIKSFRKSQLLHQMINIITTEIVKEISSINLNYNTNALIPETNFDLTINFYVKAVFGTIHWWIENEYPIEKDDLISQIAILLDIGN